MYVEKTGPQTSVFTSTTVRTSTLARMKSYAAFTFRHITVVRHFLVTSVHRQSTGCALKGIISMMFWIVREWEVIVEYCCSRLYCVLMDCQINSHFVKVFFVYHTDSMKLFEFFWNVSYLLIISVPGARNYLLAGGTSIWNFLNTPVGESFLRASVMLFVSFGIN